MTVSTKAICAAPLAATAYPAGFAIPAASARQGPVAFDLPAQDSARTLR